VLVQREGNTQLADTAILTMDGTTARLNTSNAAFFLDHIVTLNDY